MPLRGALPSGPHGPNLSRFEYSRTRQTVTPAEFGQFLYVVSSEYVHSQYPMNME